MVVRTSQITFARGFKVVPSRFWECRCLGEESLVFLRSFRLFRHRVNVALYEGRCRNVDV